MIFAAVGTQKFQFNRLLCALDELVENGIIKESVFAQIGHSNYTPKNYDYRDFLNQVDFTSNIRRCNLLITHSGVATIIAGLKCDKPVIVVPRLARYGEHVDDHQVQIAKSFSKQNFVLTCGEEDNLATLVEEAKWHSFEKYISQRQKMLDVIREFVGSLE